MARLWHNQRSLNLPGDLGLSDTVELLDISEAAQFLNVSETSLRRWTNTGALSAYDARKFAGVELLDALRTTTTRSGSQWERRSPGGTQAASVGRRGLRLHDSVAYRVANELAHRAKA